MLDFILDEMRFSYSRIETFERCPKCFYLQYIKCLKGEDGCFGQFGSLCHDTLEKYLKGELLEFQLSDEFKNNYGKKITGAFPPNKYVDLRTSYFEKGLDYFNNFTGIDGKVIGVENEYEFNVGKFRFIGKIDLETPDKIVDHKTKSKDGMVIKKQNKNHDKSNYIITTDGRFVTFPSFIQLYLYCIPYFEKHGKYPKTLALNMLKEQDWIEIEFNKSDFEKSKKWVIDTINLIYGTVKWVKGDDVGEYWCNFTCGQRFNCNHSDRYIGV
jgi:hypothetical protein